MYCTSCGKQTPDKSIFCLHCGAKISEPNVLHSPNPLSSQPVTWQYRDFVYTWTENPWIATSDPAHARLEFWQAWQAGIRRNLQGWLDKGWEPIGEIGPAGINVREYRALAKGANPLVWILFLILTVLTAGGFLLLYLVFGWRSIIEGTEFRVQMRRPMQPGDEQDDVEKEYYSRNGVLVTNERLKVPPNEWAIDQFLPVKVEKAEGKYRINLFSKTGKLVHYLESDSEERIHLIAEAINKAVKVVP